jgi:Zn finger protein HypA/HybF involved in hydrogenase expression
MHEMSVAMEICRMAEERVGPGGAAQLVAVGLEVGDDSGLEAANLEFCLEALLAEPPFAGATPVVARCAGDVLRLAYLEIDDDRPSD